jgi:capsular polysaccharide biosynthesis protein
MSAELPGNSNDTLSPTPRELAATLFRRPRLVAAAFGFVLLATMVLVVFSARYESHFNVLLRRGRFDPVVSSQPASTMDFTRPDITEEELNSEVELLRDEDLLKQVVKMAALVPADTPALGRPAETERAARKLSRRLDVDALKKSNLIQVSYKDTSPERAARILSALSVLYMQRHTNLQRPPGVIQFFDEQTAGYEKRMVPRQSWLPDACGLRLSDRNLSRLRELTTEFDFSILWCAPVSWLTTSIGHACDGMVLVLTANKTRRLVAAQIKDQLRKAQVRLLGTVLAERRFPVPQGLYRSL